MSEINILTIVEYLAVAFSVVQVLLAHRNHISHYLFGIVGVSLSMYLMFHGQLYAEFALNGYYLIMSIYGFFYWKSQANSQNIPITFTTKNQWITVVSIIVSAFIALSFILKNYTTTDVPYYDSAVSAFAWAGMWLLAKRKVENWLLLNVSNLIAIPLYIYKGYHLYAGLTVFLFIVAIFGYLKWKKEAQKVIPI